MSVLEERIRWFLNFTPDNTDRIEIISVRAEGADSAVCEVTLTRKRCRKPYYCYVIGYDATKNNNFVVLSSYYL